MILFGGFSSRMKEDFLEGVLMFELNFKRWRKYVVEGVVVEG